MLEAALVAGICAEGGSAEQPRRAADPRSGRRLRGGTGARGDDLGQPQPVPGQRDQVLRGRRAQAARRDRGRASRPSSTRSWPTARRRATGTDIGTAARRSRARSTTTSSGCVAAVEPDALRGLRDRRRLRATAPRSPRRPIALARLGAEVIVRNAEPDGININDRLRLDRPERARRRGARTAARTPGSRSTATRTGVVAVDEQGGIVDGDHILAIAAHRPAGARPAARRRDRDDGDGEPRPAPRARPRTASP